MSRLGILQGALICLSGGVVFGPSTLAYADSLFQVTPCRLLDTRVSGSKITATPRTVQARGRCGVLAEATALVGNLTVVNPATGGYLVILPAGTTSSTSTLSYRAGNTRANNFAVSLSPSGAVDLTAPPGQQVDAIIDVAGYYAPSSPHFCDGTCVPHGHFTYGNPPARYPFTEDITSQTTVPYNDPIVVPAGNDWITVQEGCDLIAGQNIQASTPVNVVLHAMTAISPSQSGYVTTAAVGARYEVQLQIDGQQYGWFNRRLRALQQNDYFEATAQNLSAGNHSYTLAVRLLDPGQVVFSQKWITATGSPATNPGGKSFLSGDLKLTPSFQVSSDTLTFIASQSLDLFLNGYMQIDPQVDIGDTPPPPGEKISVKFELDGNALRVSNFTLPPQLYAGVNFDDYRLAVSPGTHTLRWSAKTTSANVHTSWRDVEFVSFPASQGGSFDDFLSADAIRTDSLTVSTSYGGHQPSAPSLQGCGAWTPILTVSPPTNSGLFDTLAITAYVEVASVHDPGWAQFAMTQDQQGYEVGIIDVGILNSADGFYFFSDGSTDIQCSACTFTLWARKVYGCGGTSGYFNVGQRYLSIKFTPQDGCRY